MSTSLNASFFAANREKLRTLFTGTAPIVITANGLLQRNSDVNFPFRQDSTFWYLTGIEEPDVLLVMDKNKEYLIVPARDNSRAAFDGQIDTRELTKTSGIQTVYTPDEGWKYLTTRLKKVKHLATVAPSPAYIEQHGLYTNPARARLVKMIKSINSDIKLLDLRDHLTKLRMIKQPQEIVLIQEAIDITGKTLAKLHKKGWHNFAYEYEIEAAITSEFRKKGYGHAYGPIIASGKNACTLHYNHNSGPVQANSLLLIDVGAEVSHYAADITRTYSVGEPSKRHKQVYAAVLAVQEYAVSLLKPGISLKEYEPLVEQFMGEKLRELGLIKNVEHAEVRKYYPHSTSHFLGLDVHDIGEYESPLSEGVVLTVEPGIYIPEEGIGIRIEDNVLLTEKGVEVLSEKLNRKII